MKQIIIKTYKVKGSEPKKNKVSDLERFASAWDEFVAALNDAVQSDEEPLPDTIEDMLTLWYQRVADTDKPRIRFVMNSGDKIMKPYFRVVTMSLANSDPDMLADESLTLENLQSAYRRLERWEADHEEE